MIIKETSQIFKGTTGLLTFSILVLVTTIFLTFKMPTRANIMLRIQVNKGDLKSLDDSKKIKLSTTQYFESINFPSHEYLKHTSGRPLGFDKNFFLLIHCQFEVLKEGKYQISIKSDDGYRLLIDDKKIGEFISDRPVKEDVFDLTLTKGTHRLYMDYYQGFGNAALEVKYKASDEKKFTFFGVNSDNLKFIPY